MSTSENKKKFLATTAVETFWDTSIPLFFLGEWCLRHSRRAMWEPLEGVVLPSPWQERKNVRDAFNYVNKEYEKILPILSEVFNSLHGVKHGERYWRIILGPWLLYFLPVVYDRMIHLRSALELYPDITTIGLSSDNFITPKDTLEFVSLVCDDTYNLQLFTQILSFMGRDFQSKALDFETKSTPSLPTSSVLATCKKIIIEAWNASAIKLQPNNSILSKNSYFSRKVDFALLLKSFGAIWPNYSDENVLIDIDGFDLPTRSKLQSYIPDDNQFLSLLKYLIPTALPVCFIEGYKYLEQETLIKYPLQPKAVFSANSYYCDETFKQWVATQTERGMLLIGSQHGGNYGSEAMMPSEEHETAIVDRYYTWGWERSDCLAIVKPMPAVKLTGRKRVGFDTQAGGCLFGAKVMPRYLYQLPFHTTAFSEYLKLQAIFFDSLTHEFRKIMRIRFNYSDYGWDLLEQWKQRYPSVKTETWDIPFQKSLHDCRMYVCDHISTTFFEALALDKPTIIFWDPLVNELKAEAQPHYDRLREVGILYDTPEEAADALMGVYSDVGKWWNNAECQTARTLFCEQFARTSSDSLADWVREFRMIANKNI
jgi:putative transferase (TIGR04331 family)